MKNYNGEPSLARAVRLQVMLSASREAFTKSLDVVPSAPFSRRHQFLLSPSGG
jgi:hypothetical protein